MKINNRHNLGTPISDERITNGNSTDIEYAPWHASLQDPDGHFCSGAIISRRHVVTTASCVSEIEGKLRVRVGATQYNNGGLLKTVRHIMLHEDYNRPYTHDNDIALLTLAYPLTVSTFVQPIAVAHHENRLTSQNVLRVTGWNTNENSNGTEPSLDLQNGQFRLVDHRDCARAHGHSRVTINMICAKGVQQHGQRVCIVSTDQLIIFSKLLKLNRSIFHVIE